MYPVSRRYTIATYLAGSTIARAADAMSATALLLLAMATSLPASVPPLLIACLTASAALGGPLLGAVLDRAGRPGRFLAECLLLYAAGMALLTALLGEMSPVGLGVIAFASGLAGPAIAGGWTSQLGDLAGGDRLRRLQALDATTYSLAGLLGPAAAGILATTLGARIGMVLVAVLLVVAATAAVRLPRRTTVAAPPAAPVAGILSDIRSGLHAIRHTATLCRATASSCVSFIGIGMFDVLAPRIGIAHLGGAGHGAMLLSVTAATAGLTTLCLSRWPSSMSPDLLLALSMVVTTVGFAVTAVPHASTAIIGAGILGVGDGPALVQLMGIRHRDAPPRLRSQIFTTGASLKITAASVGAALAGILVDRPLYQLVLLCGLSQLGAVALLTRSVTMQSVRVTV